MPSLQGYCEAKIKQRLHGKYIAHVPLMPALFPDHCSDYIFQTKLGHVF